jgi:hypothetical protein
MIYAIRSIKSNQADHKAYALEHNPIKRDCIMIYKSFLGAFSRRKVVSTLLENALRE